MANRPTNRADTADANGVRELSPPAGPTAVGATPRSVQDQDSGTSYPMVAAFVIFLREGIEASMIVAILLSYLDQTGQRRHFRDVFAGVAAAVLLASAGGVAAYFTIRAYSGSRVQTIFETATYLVATSLLTYMTFWMHKHSRTISSELRSRSEIALSRGARFGIGALAFQAVGREGLETAVFTLAIIFATSTKGILLGAVLGLALALAIAAAVYKLGRRLNLSMFFKVVGTLLMIFAAGLLADAVENLQQLRWITILDHPLWSSSSILRESSTLGDIFHTFFGYASHPTSLQVIVYVGYLVVALGAFLVGKRMVGGRPIGQRTRGVEQATPRAQGAQQGSPSRHIEGNQTRLHEVDSRCSATRARREAQEPSLNAEMNASWGTSTRPMLFIFRLPSFCFSRSLRLRVTSPP